MVTEKLSADQVELMGHVKDPVFFSECLFTQKLQNHESLKHYKKDEFAKIRLYQLPFMSYEYLIANDPELTEEENFMLLQGAGQCFMYCGRKIGKSLIGLLIDMCLDTAHHFSDWTVGFTSFDEKHVGKIMEPYIKVMKDHPFFKLFQSDVKRKNSIVVTTPSGHSLTGVNMNLSGREPGSYFESEHFSKLYGDEMHYETQEVLTKRTDAISEQGSIERFAGITNFTPDSPSGVVFFDLDRKNWLVNAPQTVSKAWTPTRKDEAVKKHGGENSPSYRIHVMAEVIQDLEGTYDMERIRPTYYPKNKSRPIKHFELKQKDLNFKDLAELKSQLKMKLIIERPANASITYIASDFGENITEIIIVFETDQLNAENKFRYVYSITLYKMTPDEQSEIFDYLIQVLGAEITGIDCSDEGGKQVYRNLNKKYKIDNLEWVAFQEKIDIDYKRDEHGNMIKKDGKYQYEQAYVSDWSILQIKDLFYNLKINCLYDQKLDKEFGNMLSSPRLHGDSKYKSKINQDHLHQSIPEDEVVIYKANGQIKTDYVKDVYNNLSKLEVPTYNKGTVKWCEASLIKEENKGNLIYDFHFHPTSFVSVTGGHSMLIWDKKLQDLKEVLASDIKIGDLVLSLNKIPEYFNKPKKYLNVNFSWLRGKNIHRNIKVNKNLAYFLGWCTAEGSKSGDGTYQLNIGTDKKQADKLLKLFRKIFNIGSGRINLKTPEMINKQREKYENPIKATKTQYDLILGGGRGIQELITELCGQGAHNKKVPDIIINNKKTIKESFLQALIEGDGVVSTGRLTTTSKILASGMILLNQQLGVDSAINTIINKYGNEEYYITKGTRLGYYNNIPLEAFEVTYNKIAGKTKNRNKIENNNYSYAHKNFEINKKILSKIKDFNFKKVHKITTRIYNGDIYDFSVQDTNNFTAGLGNIIVHNSFQVLGICIFKNKFKIKNKPNTAEEDWGTGVCVK